MALNFPNSPSLNDTHTHNGLTWVWNGSVWEMQGSGGASVTVSDNAPSSPTHGDMWWESDTGDLKIYYDESETGAGSGAFWVSANGADSMVGISTSAPTNPQTGDLWWDSDVAALYMYYNDGNSSQWVSAASGATGAQGAAGAQGNQGVAGPTAGSNGQVVYNSGGSATGSSNLTFDGNHLTVGGNLNVGGVLTYEDVTNIDAIGIVTARTDIHVGAGVSAVGILTASTADFTGTGAVEITSGTTAQRPSSPAAGMMRYNTDNAQFEGYSSAWGGFGGASGASGNAVFYENDTNVSASYSITSGKNAMSAGPITINNGVTVTVPSGSVWTVV